MLALRERAYTDKTARGSSVGERGQFVPVACHNGQKNEAGAILARCDPYEISEQSDK